MAKLMKKSITLLTVFASLFLSACKGNGKEVTPVAYTRFISSGTQYVYYSSDAYYEQIKVYKDEDEFNAQYGIVDIIFNFERCLGSDVLEDGYRYTLVDITDNKEDIIVSIYKTSSIYDAEKKIYLNGTALTPVRVDEDTTLLTFIYNDITSFIRTNPNGEIDETKVNTLEYK